MPDRDNTPHVTALTVQLLSVYLTNNPVASKDFADLVRSTRAALSEDLARPAADSSATSSSANSPVPDGGAGLSVARRARAALGSAPRAKAGQRKVKAAALARSSRKVAVSPDAASTPNAGLIAGGSPRPLAQPETTTTGCQSILRSAGNGRQFQPSHEQAVHQVECNWAEARKGDQGQGGQLSGRGGAWEVITKGNSVF